MKKTKYKEWKYCEKWVCTWLCKESKKNYF